MQDVKQQILESGKVKESELAALVKQKMDEGARNETSALNKIWRDVRIEEVGQTEVTGFFLQDYERQKQEGSSVFVLVPAKDKKHEPDIVRFTIMDGTPKPKKALKIGDPIHVTSLVEKRNIETKSTWLETTKKTKVDDATISAKFAECIMTTELPKDGGLVFLRATVNQIWGVSEFNDGERGERLPVLEKGGKVNLRLDITPQNDSVVGAFSCKIPDEDRLRLLVGDKYDWIAEQDGVREMADMFKGTDILVFGRWDDTIGRGTADEKKVNKPFINISNVGFVLPLNE